MKAIRVVNPGADSSLEIGDIAEPNLGENEVLIRVVAAGVNRADLLQRAGRYPPPHGVSDVLGLEVSGVVEKVGSSVAGWAIGDEVCALLAGGGYAEKVAVPAGQVMRIPGGTSVVQAAAIPEAFITAYTNLCVEGGLIQGSRVLIHGGSSGVGTAAIQLAHLLGAHVACTIGSDEKGDRCLALGASIAVNYKTQDFLVAVKEWAPDGVDIVLDIIGREYFERNIAVLASRGRLVCIATMGGSKTEIDLAVIMRKRLAIIGSVLRSRSVVEKSALVKDFAERFLPAFTTGKLSPVVHATVNIIDVERAHQMMLRSEHIGKIILQW